MWSLTMIRQWYLEMCIYTKRTSSMCVCDHVFCGPKGCLWRISFLAVACSSTLLYSCDDLQYANHCHFPLEDYQINQSNLIKSPRVNTKITMSAFLRCTTLHNTSFHFKMKTQLAVLGKKHKKTTSNQRQDISYQTVLSPSPVTMTLACVWILPKWFWASQIYTASSSTHRSDRKRDIKA